MFFYDRDRCLLLGGILDAFAHLLRNSRSQQRCAPMHSHSIKGFASYKGGELSYSYLAPNSEKSSAREVARNFFTGAAPQEATNLSESNVGERSGEQSE